MTEVTRVQSETNHADLSVTVYADRVMILVTSNGRVGTVHTGRRELALDGKTPTYAVDVLMGRRGEDAALDSVYTRGLAGAMPESDPRPVLVLMGALPHDKDLYRNVIQAARLILSALCA